MPNTYTLLETITVGAEVEEKLFSLARKGDADAYVILGYVLQRTVNDNGCWTLGGKNLRDNGYTFFTLNARRAAGHRLLIEALQESLIPKGMVVDHTCHNKAAYEQTCDGGSSCLHRACFNPAHMEIVTQSENIARGSNGFWNKKTCPKGHTREAEHIRYRIHNNRTVAYCWTCHKATMAKVKRNNRQKLKALGLKEKRYG